MDIFQALLQSHERQRAISQRLLAGIGDPSERSKAFEDLKVEMAAHETAEERAFYVPLFENDETVDDARHAVSEHHEMDEMVEGLEEEACRAGSAEWLEAMGKLLHKVEHHLKEEEQKFFPAAKKVLSAQQQQELGELYQREHARLQEKEEAQG
ncbi:MAG TPA: hemerythrin domain-containing protein [Ramlibacter sp.]|nr:hemerythrin domain-containing protein [Ramlibacter sp.]